MRFRLSLAVAMACSTLGACQPRPSEGVPDVDMPARAATWNSCFWRNALKQLERNLTEYDLAAEQAFVLCQTEERVLALSLSVQNIDAGAAIMLFRSQQKQKLQDAVYKAAVASVQAHAAQQ